MANPQGREDPQPRRTLVGAGLLAAVLAAVVLASALSGPGSSGGRGARPDDPAREPPPTRAGQAAPLTEVVDVEFADPQHAFAVQNRCAGGPCRNVLLVTTDGQHWTPRKHPALAIGVRKQYVGALTALGGCRLTIDDPKPYTDRTLLHWYSDDCATTWRQVPARPRGTAARIPAGGTVGAACPVKGRGLDTCAATLVVTDPGTGLRKWLAGAPRLKEIRPSGVPQPDGGWWVTGRQPGTGRWMVAASHDDGASWSTTRLRRLTDPRVDVLSVVAGPRDAYLLGLGTVGFDDFELLVVYHSADGGRTWQLTKRYADDDHPPVPHGALARPDGLLLVTADDERAYWRSSDRGRTFAPASARAPIAAAQWTRGGYVAIAPGERPRWYHSPDGAAWTRLRFPAG